MRNEVSGTGIRLAYGAGLTVEHVHALSRKTSRCRLHGAEMAERVERIRAARTIHGGRGAEARELRWVMARLRRAARKAIAAV